MSTSQQRWLTIDGICTTLGFSRNHIQFLVRKGVLQAINATHNRRYLDPTPEYAAKLKAGEALYGRLYPLPTDIDMNALFTIREMAEILGVSFKRATTYSYEGKMPFIKVGNYRMHTVETARRMLWKRDGRKMAHQKAPFLLSQLITFFRKRYEAVNEIIPTDNEFAEDEILMRKFERMMKMPAPEREAAMRELWEKVEIAKTVATALGGDPK